MQQLPKSPHRFDIHSDPPQAPDVSLIRVLHRNEESFVAFSHSVQSAFEDANTWQPWKYVRVSDLGKTSGAIRSHLALDSYFSIHGFRRFGTRKTRDVSALNAAVVDLDFYRTPASPTWQEVVHLIEESVDVDAFPQPSILVRSGRGAWILWLLIAENDLTRAPAGPPSNQDFLRDINRRLASMAAKSLPQLGVDPACTDLSRSLRVPGSVNSHSGTTVHFLFHPTPWGTPLTYTLDSLAAEIGVEPPAFRRRQASFLKASLPSSLGNRLRRGGAKNLSRVLGLRLRELERIEESRGGFSQGHRNHAVLVLAATLRGLHRSTDEVAEYLDQVARRCQPPLASSEVRAAIKASGEHPYRHANTKIAGLLHVSVEEADTLRLTQIRPGYRPKHPEANIRKGRRQTATARRAALRTIAETNESLPPLRALAHHLQKLGFAATLRTIARDLDCLDLPRSRRVGRPTSSGHQLSLPGKMSTSRI